MDWSNLEVRVALMASIEARGLEWGLPRDELERSITPLERPLDEVIGGMRDLLVAAIDGRIRLSPDGFASIANIGGGPRSRIIAALRNELGKRLALATPSSGDIDGEVPMAAVNGLMAAKGATQVELEAAMVQCALLGWLHRSSLQHGAPMLPGSRVDEVLAWIEQQSKPQQSELDHPSVVSRIRAVYATVMHLQTTEMPSMRRPVTTSGSYPPSRPQISEPPRRPQVSEPPSRPQISEPPRLLPRHPMLAPGRPPSGAYEPVQTSPPPVAAPPPPPPMRPPSGAMRPSAYQSGGTTPVAADVIGRPANRISTTMPRIDTSRAQAYTTGKYDAIEAPVGRGEFPPELLWPAMLEKLHPSVQKTSTELFMRGQPLLAVRSARNLLLRTLEERTQLDGDARQIIDRALSPRDPVLLVPQSCTPPLAEVQEGWRLLFLGAIDVVHVMALPEGETIGREEAYYRLALLSLLFAVVDRSRRLA